MSNNLRGTKRGRRSSNSSSNSARASSGNLRPYLGSLDRFTKAEQTILQAAAEMLGVTIEKLIAGATAESNSSDDFEATDSPFSDEQNPPRLETTSGNTGDSFDSFAQPLLDDQAPAGYQSQRSTRLRNDSLIGAPLGLNMETLVANQPLDLGVDNLFNLDEFQSTSSK